MSNPFSFSSEGHLQLTPAEFCDALATDPRRLVLRGILPGTPLVFATYQAYRDFQADIALKIGVHPFAVHIRGSAKLGYSMSPRPGRSWTELHPGSDIDVAVVDPEYYNAVERAVRSWERSTKAKLHLKQLAKVRDCRRHLCYRFFDLPRSESAVRHLLNTFQSFDTTPYCGTRRSVSAFVYKDWWAVTLRYEHDLRDLEKAIKIGTVPAGGPTAQPFLPPPVNST